LCPQRKKVKVTLSCQRENREGGKKPHATLAIDRNLDEDHS